jgi:hypothetical protein
MEIKLLKSTYKKDEEFYRQFLSNKLDENSQYVSSKVIKIESIPSFPFYFGTKDDKKREESLMEAVQIIDKYYFDSSADIVESELFWHSLLCLYHRNYLLEHYPEIKDDYKSFKNIVIKNFDWQNYIYKSVLCVKYVTQYTDDKNMQEYYYKLISNNFDLFNYIIKYRIFRNGPFLIKILNIIDEENLGIKLKSKIKNEKEKGLDKRIGRQIIYEFNKSYPIILSPMLDEKDLKKYFMKFLKYYENND